MSLRVRLLIATALTMLAALAIVDVVTYVLVTNAQINQVDAALERSHRPIETLASSPDRGDWRAIPAVAPGLFVTILAPDGTVAYSADATEPGRGRDTMSVDAIDPNRRMQTISSDDSDDIRARVDELDNGFTLVVGQSLHEVNETEETLLTVLLVASAAAVVVAMAIAWVLVGAGLRPLRRVEAGAAAITDTARADQRVPGEDDRTEVGRLAGTLNAMLDRLQQASDERERTVVELRESEARMRRFVADASHELRTPIAATAAYAELFEHGARDRPDDLARAMTGIRGETDRMAELVDDLLLLARLDEHRPLGAVEVDLTEVVLASIDAARTLEPDRSIRPEISSVVTVVGDPLRLRQVIDNLLANVRAHTPVEADCVVALADSADDVRLTVSDTGPGLSEDGMAKMFDRFYRLDDARARSTGGSGLGLSIVQAIVEAHGGTILATANQPHGLVVDVVIPRVAPSIAPQDEHSDEVAATEPENAVR